MNKVSLKFGQYAAIWNTLLYLGYPKCILEYSIYLGYPKPTYNRVLQLSLCSGTGYEINSTLLSNKNL